MNMRMSSACAAAAAMVCVPLWAQEDVVVKAMRDEMDRTMKQLQLEKLEKPYFVSYRVVENDSNYVTASFGALQSSGQNRGRAFVVEVRVGDNKMDNTNFFSPGMGQVSRGQLPIEDDYKELRRQMWLTTDATYKKAVEDLSKKRAALQNQNITDETPDFTKEGPNTAVVDAPLIKADRKKWETQARSLSALFRQMPDIYQSSVQFSGNNVFVRYLNSEGTSYTRREPSASFSVSASTQGPDGTPLNDSRGRHARTLEGLPSAEEMALIVNGMGKYLTDLRASAAIENYNGPVLAEGEAAAQLFRLVFVPSLLGSHRVVMEGRQGGQDNPFIDKIGARVLPDNLSLTDNPLITEYKQSPMLGSFKVDEDGVPTRETVLVEKGILKTLLVTRDPVRGIEHSTGSRHGGHASPSNLIVTAENGISSAELRTKFLALIKQRNKEFGIVVRRMRSAEAPLLVYKVFPDGREELLHGMQFAGLNAASFKDIVATANEPYTYTIDFFSQQGGGAPSAGDTPSVLGTLAVPSFIFEDVTLRKMRGETPKPPFASHPYFDNMK